MPDLPAIPNRPLAGVILAAGQGTRMRSRRPKVLHEVAHRPLIGHVLAALGDCRPDRVVAVVAPGMAAVEAAVQAGAPGARCVVQPVARGTGDAVGAARMALDGFAGDVVVLYGDVPLIRPATIRRLVEARHAGGAAIAVLGFRPPDPGPYGRLIQDGAGRLDRIVEARDATSAELAVGLCNSGVLAVDGTRLFGWLGRISPDNAKGEYYLTDIVALANQDGLRVAVEETEAEEVLGVNSRAELAAVEAIAQRRLRQAAMASGVTLRDPATVYLAADTRFGQDVVVEPNVVFGPGVTVGDDVEIRAFSHLTGASIGAGAVVGPFARVRPGSRIGDGAHVGNFVELKNTGLGAGAKANHLAYLGDADIGPGANIGAGTITCNYDGFGKHRTAIGARAFVGSNATLVAPVAIGDDAIIGAGSTIVQDVPADALAVARAEAAVRPDGAARFRARRRSNQ